MDTKPPSNRPLLSLLWTAVALCLVGAIVMFDRTWAGVEFNAWLRGYDGCLCADCRSAFGLGNVREFSGCGNGMRLYAEDWVYIWIAGAAFFAVLALLGPTISRLLPQRVPNRARCHACKYDLTGLESDICPECGTRFSCSS